MTKSRSIPAGSDARAPSQRLTPRALLEVKRLNDPQIHPDGQRVAFTVQEADFEASHWTSHIWITEWLAPNASGDPETASDDAAHEPDNDQALAGEEPLTPDELTRQLTFSIEGESDPLWSPEGRFLAFFSSRPDTSVIPEDEDDEEAPISQIWTLPMDGGEARRITNTKEAILDFAWTPDAHGLIYLALEPRPRPLESVHRERERRKIDPIVEHDDTRRRQFWSVDVEERKPRLLFTADYGVETFALSPEGDRIAYTTNYTGEDNDYHIADIYLRDLETGVTMKLVRREGGKYRLRWSPSGTHLAFISWHDPQLSYSRESVYFAETPSHEALAAMPQPANSLPETRVGRAADGPIQHDIRRAQSWIEAPGISECLPVSDLDNDITSFEWLEDTHGILALAAVGAATHLYHLIPGEDDSISSNIGNPESHRPLEPATQNQKSEMENRKSELPADRRDLAVHRESGCAAWVQETGDSPPEIVLRDAGGQEHVLTQLNSHFAEAYRLPRQEVVQWRATDGQPIEGVLTYPLDYRADRRYPLIVHVHGGPKGRAADNLLDYTMPAVWASEGYLVLRPNYRGSEGYGHAFAVANRRDLGGADYGDVMSGVDWCLRQGLAEGDRLGILGGSYGGYMVNWAIGHTDRFKAAISMFGIFHLQTDFSNSRLSRWEHDYTGAYYWEDPEIYRKLSPASYLENMHTPTLILHGDEDDNTSISNSREIYRALLQRGVPTRFVHYPREGHGIQEPNHRLDEMRRSLAWMDRYVRNSGRNLEIYRVGDKVPHNNGGLELCVTSAEITPFTGQQETNEKDSPTSAALLEVVFTIHNLDTGQSNEPITLAVSHVRLEDKTSGEEEPILTPVGVPLDMPGGKVLIEGDNLRTTHHPDPESGQLALALAVVFRVPKSGDRLLHITDFPPVVVHWSEPDEDAQDPNPS